MFFSRKNKNKAINPIIGRERRLSAKQSKFTLVKFFYWIAFLAFIGATVYILFFSQFLAITSINIKGAEKISPEAVKSEIASRLSGKYLNFLPKDNIILVGKNKINQTLANRFKLISQVNIKKKFPGDLLVSITEKNPMLILRSGGSDYIVDGQGIAWIKADFESEFLDENNLPILEDTSGRQISEKNKELEPDYVNFILESRRRIKNDLDLEVKQLITASNISAGDIFLETNEGWKIYFSKDVGIEKEMEMLKAVLDNKVEKEKRKDLDYVDLRTNNKVYYKFK